MAGLGAFYELEVVCRGTPDPITGYLINISTIDQIVRDHAISVIQRAVDERTVESPVQILSHLLPPLQSAMTQVLRSGSQDSNRSVGLTVDLVRWKLTPYYWIAMTTASPARALLAQQFEFAAAHRLHVKELTEEQNRAVFGRCNNPNSHGHNYRIEPVVAVDLDSTRTFTLQHLEQIVSEIILQRFDHKHLNLDLKEFAGVNPSVEHIARICFDLLRTPIEAAGATLQHVTVWETEKTRCTYPAGSGAPVGSM